jgi:hypothetical protein
VTFRGSLCFVVAVEYTLRVDSDDKGTGYAAGSLVIARVSWDASRRGPVTFRGSLSFVVAVEYSTLSRVYCTLHMEKYRYIDLFISFRWIFNDESNILLQVDREGRTKNYLLQWRKRKKKKSPAGQDSNLHFPHYPKVRLTSHYVLCRDMCYQLHHPDWR